MSKAKILLQLDPDQQPSVFDSVVAVDAGVDHLLRHGGVTTAQATGLVHGAIFTRGPDDLRSTAIFIGGADVAAGESLLQAVQDAFFGPMRVSVLLDANGANTTAAAAVLAAARHVELKGTRAVVLGGTGPVGQRAARLLAGAGARVRVASRSRERAEQACQRISRAVAEAQLEAVATDSEQATAAALEEAEVLIAAGAAGVELVSAEQLTAASSLRVAIDLNAVPPLGIGSVEAADRGRTQGPTTCYGAIGVGGDKMKIHKAAVASLFEANDRLLDAEQVFELGRRVLDLQGDVL